MPAPRPRISNAIRDGRSYAERVEELRTRRSLPPRRTGTRRTRGKRECSYEMAPEGHLVVTIPGAKVLLSAEDAHLLEEYLFARGSKDRIVALKAGARPKALSRVVLSCPPGKLVDHVNGDQADNRRANLRVCTHSENAHNMRAQHKPMASVYKGVAHETNGPGWRAYIYQGGKQFYLGHFSAEEAAALAYDAAARERFGAFACLNFPKEGEQSAHRGKEM